MIELAGVVLEFAVLYVGVVLGLTLLYVAAVLAVFREEPRARRPAPGHASTRTPDDLLFRGRREARTPDPSW